MRVEYWVVMAAVYRFNMIILLLTFYVSTNVPVNCLYFKLQLLQNKLLWNINNMT